jgi:hypothetical protein
MANRLHLVLLAASGLLTASPLCAAWEVVEDFDALTPGPASKAGRIVMKGDASVFDVVAEGDGKFLRSARSAGDWKLWWAAIPLPRPVDPASRAVTFYTRFRWRGAGNAPLDISFGLTRGPVTGTADFQLYRVQVAPERGADGLGLRVRNGDALTNAVLGLAPDVWFQCWLVIDNQAGTFRLYLAPGASGAGPENLLGDAYAFRTGEPMQGPLTHFAVMRSTKQGTTAFDLDNIWIDYAGVNLASPPAAGAAKPPAPGAR